MNQIFGITLKFFRSGRFSAVAALVGMGLLLIPAGARAGCGFANKAAAIPATPAPPIPFVSPRANQPSNHQDDEESGQPVTIVGLWHVVYTATYSTSGPLPVPIVPPGSFTVAQSFKTWHADGTEFDNVFQSPSGGNICYGVWKDLGRRTMKVHHVGLMFGPDGSLANIFTIDEIDTLAADGKTYEGIFDQRLYESADVFGTGKVVQEFKGTTAATRITVD